MNKSGQIGTKAESAVVKVLIPNGFPHCERRRLRGANDAGDLTGTPGICWSVKGGEMARQASDLDIEKWMAELATQIGHAKADVGVLVVQRKGVGYDNAHRWWAVMPAFMVADLIGGTFGPHHPTFPVRMLLADAVSLLRAAGYGEPEPRPAVAPYLPAAAAPEGITDIALPGLETVR